MNSTAEDPKKVRNAAETPKVKVLPLNNRRSSIGESVRNSHQINVTSIDTAAAKATMIGGEVQPALLPVVIATIRAIRTPVDKAAPHQSNRVPLISWTSFQPRITQTVATTPMASSGRVRKNTTRQPKASTTKPPMAGPATAPTPTMVMNSPIARPFSLAGKAAVMMAMPVPWVMADPTPCNTRDGNIISKAGESPDRTAPAANTTIPVMYIFFRPTRSDNRPMGSSRAAMVRA